mmetsp:Transcript_2530/g.4278  ORF Transcript_2530/g.4278 Transcript_2530/m.4278 type:complete len:82 (+) Transcript_2530:1064-1309(+)
MLLYVDHNVKKRNKSVNTASNYFASFFVKRSRLLNIQAECWYIIMMKVLQGLHEKIMGTLGFVLVVPERTRKCLIFVLPSV